MTFANLVSGTAVFLDANTFVYHFVRDPQFGRACSDLLDRIDRGDLSGFTSAHVLSEMAHRLMTHEACSRYTWPAQGIAARLKRHPTHVQQLNPYRRALDEVRLIGIRVLSVTSALVSRAADVTWQDGPLSNDALVVVVKRQHGLTALASHDTDFDRLNGLARYAPI